MKNRVNTLMLDQEITEKLPQLKRGAYKAREGVLIFRGSRILCNVCLIEGPVLVPVSDVYLLQPSTLRCRVLSGNTTKSVRKLMKKLRQRGTLDAC